MVDTEELVRELEANLNVVVGSGSTLTDDSSDHIAWLADRRASIEWNFTRRYQRFLRERKGWALPTLQRSDDLTDRVLELIEDPFRRGSWDRRGMVVGEVQSGKTSNYIELICKVSDAGYKFIVVLTGTTNSLRAQTQLRFDEGFLGWDTRLNLALDTKNKRVGVGMLVGEPLLRAIPSTNGDEMGDFNLRVANQFNVRLGGDPVIMVVKKNSSVLRNLTRWARSLNPVGPRDPMPNTPMLVIDDEARLRLRQHEALVSLRRRGSHGHKWTDTRAPQAHSSRVYTSDTQPHHLPTSSYTQIRMRAGMDGTCSLGIF